MRVGSRLEVGLPRCSESDLLRFPLLRLNEIDCYGGPGCGFKKSELAGGVRICTVLIALNLHSGRDS